VATVRDRLAAFMKQHKLTRQRMADALQTPVGTLNSWMDEGVTPPACMVAMLDLLEGYPRVRHWIGATAQKVPRGRPFLPGNAWRLDSARAQALRAKALEASG
jgi:hypothetical protein